MQSPLIFYGVPANPNVTDIADALGTLAANMTTIKSIRNAAMRMGNIR